MGILDSLNDVLQNYSGGQNQNSANAVEHFDQVAQAAPHSVIAEGLAAAFRSDQTPAFGNLVGNLFGQSSGEQKAGILNQLLASVGPGVLAQLGGGALTGLLGRAGSNHSRPSPDRFARSRTAVGNPCREDRSVHCGQSQRLLRATLHLGKDLGGAALTIALAKVAERQRAA